MGLTTSLRSCSAVIAYRAKLVLWRAASASVSIGVQKRLAPACVNFAWHPPLAGGDAHAKSIGWMIYPTQEYYVIQTLSVCMIRYFCLYDNGCLYPTELPTIIVSALILNEIVNGKCS